MIKTKAGAIKVFGSITQIAKALGVSKQAISKWPDKLNQGQIDRLNGAVIRLNKRRKDR